MGKRGRKRCDHGFPKSAPPYPAANSILKPTCVGGTTVDENQSEPEPTMKRLSLFSTAIISILFLPVFLSNGQQTNTLPNGAQYIGEMKDGKPNDQGTLIWPDGWRFVGEFRDGKRNGHGMLTLPDGRKYVGEFSDGRINGQGTETFSDGAKYVGEFRID